ncbi:MAG: 5'-3' exonuclease [Frankiaceae bacterium]|nr:5'-3' exonuclease [Frankiaceae bacterium]
MLLLLDTASLYFRAFYGTPDTITAPDGTPVNAVRGLLDYISRLVDEHRPSHLVAAMDNSWRPEWRVAAVPSYKTHRVADAATNEEEVPDLLSPQVPIIEAVLDAFGICRIGADDYEADDVIGTLATNADQPVEIVTGDRDLFQLVDDSRGVVVIYVAKGVNNRERIDEAEVARRYGIPGRSYADFATLRGDPSDGLPGLKGVGEKTAAQLINAFGDVAGVIAAAEGDGAGFPKGCQAKVLAGLDYLGPALKVVEVAKDVPLGNYDATLPTAPRDPDLLEGLADRWGLTNSINRLTAVLAAR